VEWIIIAIFSLFVFYVLLLAWLMMPPELDSAIKNLFNKS